MIDFRLETFLVLCQTGSYTRAAEQLHITQPAVTQHIQYLEKQYGGKLFCYCSRTLTLTPRGELLRQFAMTMQADSMRLMEMMQQKDLLAKTVTFGATQSIGEYVMPRLLERQLEEKPDTRLSMVVENTQDLLERLQEGKINFAFLEGCFDKAQYETRRFIVEPFIPVCAADSPLAEPEAKERDMYQHRLILREKGSGNRQMLELLLARQNLTVDSFSSVIEVGNMNAIKYLVAQGLGITFLYRLSAREELRIGRLREICPRRQPFCGEINFVCLKNSLHLKEYLGWYEYFKETWHHIRQEPDRMSGSEEEMITADNNYAND